MTKPIYRYNPRLDRLERWLNYELSAGTLFMVSFFYGFAFYLLGIAIIIFVPYMVYVLLKEKRFGWLGSFAVLILMPGILSSIFLSGSMWSFVVNYSIIGLFFSTVLRLSSQFPSGGINRIK